MLTRPAAFLLAIGMSGCVTAGKLREITSSDFPRVQKLEVLAVGVPTTPRVQILNSNSDWFHVPGFAAKGVYVGYLGAEVGALLESVGFDYGGEAARLFQQSAARSGLSLLPSDAAVLSENRKGRHTKCPRQTEADACLDLYLTYFGYVAASDISDYVPTAHLSARVIRKSDGKLLFDRNIHYNPIDPGRAIDVFASGEFRFNDLDAMKANPQGVAAGLKAALNALSIELEAQLRSALK